MPREGIFIDESDIEIWLTFLDTLVQHIGNAPVYEPGQTALGVVELADGVVHVQGAVPVTVRDGPPQQGFKFRVRDILDIAASDYC